MITCDTVSLLALISPDATSALLRIAATSLMVPLVPLIFVVAADAWRGAEPARGQRRARRVKPRLDDGCRDPHYLVFRSVRGVPRVLPRLGAGRLGSQLPASSSKRRLAKTDGDWFGQGGAPN
jgi:hypothetical protein